MSPTKPILVTGDTHLRGDPDEPAWGGFRKLCKHAATECAALYHLGDLFDYWVGPKQATLPAFRAILDLLAETAAQVPIHVLHGNRDFAMGDEIGTIPGVTLHAGDVEVDYGGKRALITHGDLLLADDRAYQRMRRVLRHPAVRGTIRRLPLKVALRGAGAMRGKSTTAVAKKPASAFAIYWPTVRDLLRDNDRDVVIAGHVHRPRLHVAEVSGRERQFITIGAWGARGWVVRLERGTATLERFPGGGGTPAPEPFA